MSAHNKKNGEPIRTLSRSLRILNKKNKESAECLPTNKRAKKDKNVRSKPIFPRDVFTEILSWLPIDYLLQVQLVCKEWQAIIHDHYFLEKQMAHSSVVLYIVLHILNDPTLPLRLPQPQPSLASKPKPDLIIYTGGCDGLVIYYSMAKHKYLLWNPAIHCVLELPNPPQGVNYGCALCYIPSSKTYKKVRFYKDKDDKDNKGCDVLTPSPSMSWRQLVFPDIANANEGGKKEMASVFSAGGDVHFVVVTEVGKETDIKIVTLDVATECFTVNRLPNGVFKT